MRTNVLHSISKPRLASLFALVHEGVVERLRGTASKAPSDMHYARRGPTPSLEGLKFGTPRFDVTLAHPRPEDYATRVASTCNEC